MVVRPLGIWISVCAWEKDTYLEVFVNLDPPFGMTVDSTSQWESQRLLANKNQSISRNIFWAVIGQCWLRLLPQEITTPRQPTIPP